MSRAVRRPNALSGGISSVYRREGAHESSDVMKRSVDEREEQAREREVTPFSSLHVIVACHNRRDLTVRAISGFARAAQLARVHADFVVFDDGSTDGTAEALASLGLEITRIAGDGLAFWARGMAEAESHVLQTYDDDGYVVWLNDDVELDEDFLDVALAAAKRFPSAVLVGAMRDPVTGNLTYSGWRRAGLHPLSFAWVEPNGTLQSVESSNGNLVFVPINVARALGGIDGAFPHAGADTDYGLRVREMGFELLLLPRIVGSCAHNPVPPVGRVLDDWRVFLGVKSGANFTTMKRILQERHQHTWLGYILVTYSLWWIRRFGSHLQALGRRGSG